MKTRHTPVAMLRHSVYGHLVGYEDVSGAERLRIDPTMRRVVGSRAKEKMPRGRARSVG